MVLSALASDTIPGHTLQPFLSGQVLTLFTLVGNNIYSIGGNGDCLEVGCPNGSICRGGLFWNDSCVQGPANSWGRTSLVRKYGSKTDAAPWRLRACVEEMVLPGWDDGGPSMLHANMLGLVNGRVIELKPPIHA